MEYFNRILNWISRFQSGFLDFRLERLPLSLKLYADIPSWRASNCPLATLPSNISISTARPDIVLIEDSNIMLVEHTVPSEALLAARQRKANKPAYLQLISDLEDRSFSVSYNTLYRNWLPGSLLPNCREN